MALTGGDSLRAAAELANDPTFYVEARVGSNNYRGECVRALWRDARNNARADELLKAFASAYLDSHPADDGEPVTEEWLHTAGLTERWYDDTWGTPLHSTLPVGIAVQAGGRAMVRLGKTLSYLGDVILPTRGDVRRLLAALKISPAAERSP